VRCQYCRPYSVHSDRSLMVRRDRSPIIAWCCSVTSDRLKFHERWSMGSPPA
jgi:hypothetical protein